MSQTVEVPKLGEVEFPDYMSPPQMQDAIETHLGKNKPPALSGLLEAITPIANTALGNIARGGQEAYQGAQQSIQSGLGQVGRALKNIFGASAPTMSPEESLANVGRMGMGGLNLASSPFTAGYGLLHGILKGTPLQQPMEAINAPGELAEKYIPEDFPNKDLAANLIGILPYLIGGAALHRAKAPGVRPEGVVPDLALRTEAKGAPEELRLKPGDVEDKGDAAALLKQFQENQAKKNLFLKPAPIEAGPSQDPLAQVKDLLERAQKVYNPGDQRVVTDQPATKVPSVMQMVEKKGEPGAEPEVPVSFPSQGQAAKFLRAELKKNGVPSLQAYQEVSLLDNKMEVANDNNLLRNFIDRTKQKASRQIPLDEPPVAGVGAKVPPTLPDDLRPAIRKIDGSVIEGELGQVHNDLLTPMKATDVDARGFVDKDGNWVDRLTAEAKTGVTSTKPVPGLHADDLAKAQGILPSTKQEQLIQKPSQDLVEPTTANTGNEGSIPQKIKMFRGTGAKYKAVFPDIVKGVWYTPSEEIAKGYGPNIVEEAPLSNKPFIVKNEADFSQLQSLGDKATSWLQEQGYDSVRFDWDKQQDDHPYAQGTLVSLDPKQQEGPSPAEIAEEKFFAENPSVTPKKLKVNFATMSASYRGLVQAFELKDGTVVANVAWGPHIKALESGKVNPEDISRIGFLDEGKFSAMPATSGSEWLRKKGFNVGLNPEEFKPQQGIQPVENLSVKPYRGAAPERQTAPQQRDVPGGEVSSEPPTPGGPTPKSAPTRPVRVEGDPVGEIQTADEKMKALGEDKPPEPNLSEQEKNTVGEMMKRLRSDTGAVTLFSMDDFEQARDHLKEVLRLALTREGKYPGGALYSRLGNVMHPDEKVIMEANGLKEFTKTNPSPEELVKWMQQNGPKVEVKLLSAELGRGFGPKAKRLAQVEHELDTISPNWRNTYPPNKGIPEDAPEQVKKFLNEVGQLHGDVQIEASGGSAPSKDILGYSTLGIATPKDPSQMPGAVDLLVRIPQRQGSLADYNTSDASVKFPLYEDVQVDKGIKYSSSHYPTEGKNLVAHVRGYMETLPDRRKVFHVFEVQSDWAQEARELTQTPGNSTSRPERFQEPMLKHYERLALKAAIDHARTQGADAIAISDGPTAMMTGGQDRSAHIYQRTQEGERFLEHGMMSDALAGAASRGESGYRIEIPQEKGMRLHYDQTLPKIAKDLTGGKGERVSFGTHQNAVEKVSPNETGRVMVGELNERPRSNLIFRNPDGSPKTDITARLYSFEKTKKPFTLLGSDKPSKTKLMSEGGSVRVPTREDFDKFIDTHLGTIGRLALRERDIADFKLNTARVQDSLEEVSSRMGLMAKNRVNKEWFHGVSKLDKQTTQFILEANYNKGELAKDVDKLKGTAYEKVGQRALELISNPGFVSKVKTIEEYFKSWHKKLTKEGVLVGEEEKNYIARPFSDIQDPVLGRKTNVKADPTRTRNIEKLVDRLAAGEKLPLDIGDIVEQYSNKMTSKILSKQIFNKMFEGKQDTLTGKAIKADLVEEGGKSRPPSGYDVVHIAGQDVAVLKGYSGPIKAMFSSSELGEEGVLGRGLLATKGISKAGQLGLDVIHVPRVGWRLAGHMATANWLEGDFLPHLRRSKLLYENSPSTIQAMVKRGELKASEAKEIEADRPYMDSLTGGGINIYKHMDNVYGETIKQLPGLKQVNRFVFDYFSRSVISKMSVEFYKGALEQADTTLEKDAASGYKVRNQVVKDIHNSFGNYGRQGFLKSRTLQDMSQLVLLAPGWEQAELRSDFVAAGQLVKGAVESVKQKKLVLGNLARVKLGMAAVALTSGQIASMMMNDGEPTWEVAKNRKDGQGHEWDTYFPFGNKGKGYYVNFWKIPAALTATIYDYQKRGRDPVEAWAQWSENKLSGPARASEALLLGRGPMGSKLVGGTQRLKTAGEELLPIPLQLKDVTKPGEDLTRQGIATVTGVQPEAAGVSVEEKARRMRVSKIYELQAQLRHTKDPSQRKEILAQIKELRNAK